MATVTDIARARTAREERLAPTGRRLPMHGSDDPERVCPRQQGDDGPCPFVSCRKHLYGTLRSQHQDLGDLAMMSEDLDETGDWLAEQVAAMPDTCAVDVAIRSGGSGLTLEEVANYFGVSRERIRQIESKGTRRLRGGIKSRRTVEMLRDEMIGDERYTKPIKPSEDDGDWNLRDDLEKVEPKLPGALNPWRNFGALSGGRQIGEKRVKLRALLELGAASIDEMMAHAEYGTRESLYATLSNLRRDGFAEPAGLPGVWRKKGSGHEPTEAHRQARIKDRQRAVDASMVKRAEVAGAREALERRPDRPTPGSTGLPGAGVAAGQEPLRREPPAYAPPEPPSSRDSSPSRMPGAPSPGTTPESVRPALASGRGPPFFAAPAETSTRDEPTSSAPEPPADRDRHHASTTGAFMSIPMSESTKQLRAKIVEVLKGHGPMAKRDVLALVGDDDAISAAYAFRTLCEDGTCETVGHAGGAKWQMKGARSAVAREQTEEVASPSGAKDKSAARRAKKPRETWAQRKAREAKASKTSRRKTRQASGRGRGVDDPALTPPPATEPGETLEARLDREAAWHRAQAAAHEAKADKIELFLADLRGEAA